MVFATRIECASALRALASAFHIFSDGQDMLALPTKHRTNISLIVRPDIRIVSFAGIVTTDARVELLAAEMLDGDDVEPRVPVGALG